MKKKIQGEKKKEKKTKETKKKQEKKEVVIEKEEYKFINNQRTIRNIIDYEFLELRYFYEIKCKGATVIVSFMEQGLELTIGEFLIEDQNLPVKKKIKKKKS
jgi:hypothetical protein